MNDALAALMSTVPGIDAACAPEPWRDQAACRGMAITAFFDAITSDAVAACRRCPVARERADYATQHHIKFGMWGGRPGWIGVTSRPRRKSG